MPKDRSRTSRGDLTKQALKQDPYIKKLLAKGHSIEDLQAELEIQYKAGVIPFVILDDDSIEMAFVKDDANKPLGIIKGGADPGERNPMKTALREALYEAHEEVGLRKKHLKSFFSLNPLEMKGKLFSYTLHVYGAELRKKPKLTPQPGEVISIHWLKPNQISQVRKQHRPFIQDLLARVNNK